MFSSVNSFVASQVVTNTLWSIAETGVQQIHNFAYNYLPAQLVGPTDTMDPQPSPQTKKIYYISFNQDCTNLAVGHDDGYSFYNLRLLDKLEKISDSKVPERVCIVEKLYSSSLITVVSLKSTRKLQNYHISVNKTVFHSKKENEICSHTYASSIIAVRMNRRRVIVCLEDAIHIHNIRDMRILHMLKDTPPNPNGIVDLSNDDNNCFLAFPCSSSTGHVHIFDAENLNTMCQITAHDGVLAAVRFNPEGTKLATASEKGTVIRVFAIPSGERLYEFTRGVTRYAQINSLAFSQDSRHLCLSSNTETVHVFALLTPTEQQQQQQYHPHPHHVHQKSDETVQEGLTSWFNWGYQQASNYLPQHVNELILREKSAATARLPILGTRTVVAMPRIQGVDYLMVASLEGYLFCYSLPAETGGECNLIRQYRIGPPRVGEKEMDSECGIEGTPVSISGGSAATAASSSVARPSAAQRQNRNSESEAKSQTPTKPTVMRGASSGGSGSSSSLSSASAAPGTPKQQQQMPPPVPPNPPKRNTAANKSGKESAKVTPSKNPFDMEDLLVAPLVDESEGDDELGQPTSGKWTDSSGKMDMMPPADLNDLDEFPPLHHPTN